MNNQKQTIITTNRQSLLSSRAATTQLEDYNINISSVNNTNNNMSSRKSSRAISPVHLPNVIKASQSSNVTVTRPISVTTKDKFQKSPTDNSGKLPDLVPREYSRDSANLSRLSASILNPHQDIDDAEDRKKELNEKTRIGILKGIVQLRL